ncbi:MAG: hypothetical protein KDI30_13220, partial [Pseudomonadales bacterium]|nr:hypothetical protein [Pseudomonadales bacterium]
RCQLFSIPEPPFEQGLAWLMQFEHDKDKASSLLRLSASRPLLARKYFEEGSDNLYEEMVEGLISLRSRKLLIVELAGKWHKNLAIYDFWFHWLLEDLKAVFNGCTQQTGLSAESIQVFLKKLINAKKQALSTANPNLQLLLEALLVDWLMLPVE